MEIGDTVCNVYDYDNVGKVKGHIVRIIVRVDKKYIAIEEDDRIHLITSDMKRLYGGYYNFFAVTRIVLLEKYNPTLLESFY